LVPVLFHWWLFHLLAFLFRYVPVIFSVALNSVKEHHGSFAGILLTGITGGAVIPLIIGWLGDHLGLRSVCVSIPHHGIYT
jgi:fucose permease